MSEKNAHNRWISKGRNRRRKEAGAGRGIVVIACLAVSVFMEGGRNRRCQEDLPGPRWPMAAWSPKQSDALRELAERYSKLCFGFEDGRTWLLKGILRD